MATRSAILEVGVKGEQQYKQAIAELNRGNQVLNAEMKKLAEEYKGNESSMEAMRAKSDVLERQLSQQKDKVQTLRDALQNAATSFGEADRRTQSWQTQLLNAERDQIKLERSLEETNKAIEEQGNAIDEDSQEMTKLGDAVDQVADKLGIHLPKSAKEALNGFEGLSAGSVAGMAATAGAVAGVIKIAQELHEITLEAAVDVDALLTQSVISGVSTDTLQAWTYAQELIDVSVETMTSSLTKLTNSIYDASQGNDKLAETFESLGVSIEDTSTGQLRPAEDVFYDVIDALGGMEDQTKRDAVAMDLMGKSAQELNPLIASGSKALKGFEDAARDCGYVLDEYQIKKLAAVDDQYQETQLAVDAFEKKIAVEFAPASQKAMEIFEDAVTSAGNALVDSGLVEYFGTAVSSVLGLVEAGGRLISSLPEWINPLQNVAREMEGLAYVAATVADAVDLVSGLMPWNWGSGQASTALGWNIDKGQMSHIQQVKYRNGVSYNAAGDDNWRGGLTWVGDGGGPELVRLPQGSTIYNAQESRQIAAASATDTSRIESLLERCLQRMDGIERELADAEAVRRMA